MPLKPEIEQSISRQLMQIKKTGEATRFYEEQLLGGTGVYNHYAHQIEKVFAQVNRGAMVLYENI